MFLTGNISKHTSITSLPETIMCNQVRHTCISDRNTLDNKHVMAKVCW